jgi:hypothetical protein
MTMKIDEETRKQNLGWGGGVFVVSYFTVPAEFVEKWGSAADGR